jgi:hypothetical protein
MSNKKMMTPEEELRDLSDFSVEECVAQVTEFAPGTEYFKPEDAETLIKFLQQTPDLTGIILDGLASVHRPGILHDDIVFYNKTEAEMLAHMKAIPRHEHVHWMFNQLMKIQNEWLGKFRKALPKVKIVYSIDSDDFHSMCERMLRVIVQSGKVKISASKKVLEKSGKELQSTLDGVGTLKESDLQTRLAELQDKRQKQVEDRAQKRVAQTDKQIAEVKSDIALIKRFVELKALREELTRGAKNAKRLEETEAEWLKVSSAVDIKQQGLEKTLVSLNAKRTALKNVAGKQKARETLDNKIAKCKEDIAAIKKQIASINTQIEELEDEFTDLREPETSPAYQRRVDEHVKQLYKRYHELGKTHDIKILTKPDVLVFGKLVIDYAHDRGRTWAPMMGRVKMLARDHIRHLRKYRTDLAVLLKDLKAETDEIDVVLESGHHGVFFARWQRTALTPEEIRMQHVNSFYTGGNDGVKHIVYMAGMPFEPQDRISLYLNRGKPARTRGGKPINSAHHPVFVRNQKGSVSGTQLIRKHRHGIISVEPIAYSLFEDKQVLEPFKAVMSQDDSDNHLNSPEMDPLGTLGTMAMNEQLMKNPLQLYGQKVYIGGTLNIGDTAEANSNVWKEATKFRNSVMDAVKELPRELVATNMDDYEAVLKTTIKWLNDMSGGSNENMKLTMRVVRWFLKKKLLGVLHNSPARLRDILVSLEGNHAANALSKFSGVQEFTSFEEWLFAVKSMPEDFPELGLKPFPLKIEAGGEPHQPTSDDTEMVVHLGGYSVARQAFIPEYGVGHDGKLLVQKTYRMAFTHEPNAIKQKAVNADADAIKAGHTHESYLEADNAGHNTIRFIDQKPCTQRVSATELSYGGLPRTAGVDLCIYTQPGRYWKTTIPMQHMRKIGLAQMKIWAKQAVDKKKK